MAQRRVEERNDETQRNWALGQTEDTGEDQRDAGEACGPARPGSGRSARTGLPWARRPGKPRDGQRGARCAVSTITCRSQTISKRRDVKQPTGFMVNEPLTSEQGTVTTCRNYGKCVLRIWHLRTCEDLHFRQGKTCSAVNTTRQHEASFDMEGRENTLEQACLLAIGLCSHAGSRGRCSCSRTSP